MEFRLALWPDLDEDATPQELLAYAVESVKTNPDLAWDIADDVTGEVIHETVVLPEQEPPRIWVLTVDDSAHDLFTEVHATEAEAIASLAAHYEVPDTVLTQDVLQYVIDTERAVIYLTEHVVPR